MTTTPTPKSLEHAVAAATWISHVDSLTGELILGGYRLDEIADRAVFERIAWALWQPAMGYSADRPKSAEYAESSSSQRWCRRV